MSFQPFFALGDSKTPGFKETWMPTDQGMKHAYLSTTNTVNRPLVLTYKPRVADGIAYSFQSLDSIFREVAIVFKDPNRDVYSSFKPSEFNCQVVMTGKVELRVPPTMPPSDTGGYSFNTTIVDPLSNVGMFVLVKTPDSIAPKVLNVGATGFKCVDNERTCKITGNIFRGLEEEFERIDL